jgi:hypothetical protein
MGINCLKKLLCVVFFYTRVSVFSLLKEFRLSFKGEMPADLATSVQVMERLCKYIYAKDGTDRLRTRAILAHIYHHALHDNWFQARDLILMSHLQEAIQHSDPATQVKK